MEHQSHGQSYAADASISETPLGLRGARTDIRPRNISVAEAARQLGVCRMTLYRMRDAGEIHFGKLRRRTVISCAEVERVQRMIEGPNREGPVERPVKPRPKKVKLYPRVV